MSTSRIRWPFSKKKTNSIPCGDLQNHEPASPSLTPPSPQATANSPFFQRFPAEIREQILIEAFGKNAIHLHAELEYAEENFRLPPPTPRQPRSRCNCSSRTPLDQEQNDRNATAKDETYRKELVYHDTIKEYMSQVGGYPTVEDLAANPKFCPYHIIQPKERWRIVPGSENSGMPSAGIIQTTRKSDGPGRPRPTRWRYSSSICHELVELFDNPHYSDQSSLSSRLRPWYEMCLYNGFAPDIANGFPHNHTRQKCLIGIVGFLMSCKQAYLEALPVLYERNLFHLSSDLMLRRLPYILPTQRLESIATVELVWDLYPRKLNNVYCEKHERTRQLTSFEERLEGLRVMMQQLASRMPGLRNVWLCLQSNVLPDKIAKEERVDAVGRVLTTIDQGILQLTKLENARVAFPDSFFGDYGASSSTDMPKKCICRGTRGGYMWWRDLSGREMIWEESDWEQKSLGKGYWIMPGKCDVKFYYHSNCGM
ncbi:hypothetical protein QBC40DRAFT_264771 [Triangularia verruculosa]|uniref:DUF7730 domain-containing protein n=1 Tax=Triangularia verruculosa TaxID=2587418 RepID=A0AAN7AXB6_9PEZI|nr:hypothetical protein QBC40DRAFT_264771 [Triangularia verruculosa]